MTQDEEIALLANVKAITDKLDIVDKIFAANRMGVNMVLCFMCGESGLYYPADYVKNWGKDWGIGLGPSVCSESLQSEYDVAPPAITPDIESIDQIMHPLRVSGMQMDQHLVEASAFAANCAVAAKGDEKMKKRAPILLGKQLANPRSKLGIARAAFAQVGR